jgi:hypothetical protein
MAWPKLFNEIKAQLDRIEAKLDMTLPKPLTPPDPPTLEEQAAAFAESIAYDTYAVSELQARAGSLAPVQRALLRTYEASHRNRKGALAALEGPS